MNDYLRSGVFLILAWVSVWSLMSTGNFWFVVTAVVAGVIALWYAFAVDREK